MTPIWTLDARNSFLLDIVEEYFGLSAAQIQREILRMHEGLLRTLQARNFRYNDFRNALVPQIHNEEYAFLFDTSVIDDAWYSLHIGARFVPALERDHNCCIQIGDLVIADQALGYSLLTESAIVHKACEISNTSQLCAVYVNNLTSSRAQALNEKLSHYQPYIGYIPATYSSRVKDWLSGTLSCIYLKIGNRWLSADDEEDDILEDVDHNVPGWPLAEHGYTNSTIRPLYFHHFLRYKIERAVYPGFESDTRFALAAISGAPREIADFRVLVERAKGEYLRREKAGDLARAGIEHLPDTELQALIANKILRNYLYQLDFKYGKSFFNIMLEVKNPDHVTPTKLLAALEYQPNENTLRLVTLF
jgi:hypothetical protein